MIPVMKMKEITNGFYRRRLKEDRYLTVEVLLKAYDETPEDWKQDEALTAVRKYSRKAGTVTYRIGANEPFTADLHQVKFDILPEEEWYEYFTAGMSDIHPNDRMPD